jgi:hypothetical protein
VGVGVGGECLSVLDDGVAEPARIQKGSNGFESVMLDSVAHLVLL